MDTDEVVNNYHSVHSINHEECGIDSPGAEMSNPNPSFVESSNDQVPNVTESNESPNNPSSSTDTSSPTDGSSSTDTSSHTDGSSSTNDEKEKDDNPWWKAKVDDLEVNLNPNETNVKPTNEKQTQAWNEWVECFNKTDKIAKSSSSDGFEVLYRISDIMGAYIAYMKLCDMQFDGKTPISNDEKVFTQLKPLMLDIDSYGSQLHGRWLAAANALSAASAALAQIEFGKNADVIIAQNLTSRIKAMLDENPKLRNHPTMRATMQWVSLMFAFNGVTTDLQRNVIELFARHPYSESFHRVMDDLRGIDFKRMMSFDLKTFVAEFKPPTKLFFDEKSTLELLQHANAFVCDAFDVVLPEVIRKDANSENKPSEEEMSEEESSSEETSEEGRQNDNEESDGNEALLGVFTLLNNLMDAC